MRITKIIPPILEMKKVKVGVITRTDWVLEPWLGVATEWRKERHTDTKTTKLDRGASIIQPSLLTTSVYLVDTAEGEGLAGLCRGLCTQAADCKYPGEEAAVHIGQSFTNTHTLTPGVGWRGEEASSFLLSLAQTALPISHTSVGLGVLDRLCPRQIHKHSRRCSGLALLPV